jgi:HEPN domain-containing protein
VEDGRPQLDDVGGQNLFEQVLELWVQPELERRKSEGSLPDGFTLFAIQILFHQDRDNIEIRFNDQVKGQMEFKTNRAFEAGEAIENTDIAEVVGFHLLDEDGNAGHITLFLLVEGWHINFDSRYNAVRVRETVDAAREFLATAEDSLKHGRTRALLENLFSATELMSKAHVLMLPGDDILKRHRHGFIGAKFNSQSRHTNVNPEFPQLLNRLTAIRGAARYLRGEWNLDSAEAGQLMETANRMLDDLLARIPVTAKPPGA